MEELTTISLSREIRNKLEAKKVHPNQSFDEVIRSLLDSASK